MAARVVGGRFLQTLNKVSSYGGPLRSRMWTRCLQTTTQLNDAVSIRMPALSPTMTEGTIVKWYKKEGDAIQAGDVLCDIQTDKAVVSFEIEEDGILAKILKAENSKDVKLGTLIGLMVDEGEDWRNVAIPADAESDGQQPAGSAGEQPAAPATGSTLPLGLKHHGYGPAVRSLLELYQLKIGDISGTGPHNRVLKGDVLKFIEQRGLKPAPVAQVATPAPPAAAAPPPPPTATPVAAPPAKKAPPAAAVQTEGGYSDLELTSMRKTIAKRLTESKVTIPHAYSAIECSTADVLQARKQLIADGIRVSVNDFVIKAAAVALQKVPEVNAGWAGDTSRQFSDVDIAVAVATENGLITPIVRDAVGKGVQQISAEVAELAGRARQGKLKPHEFQGGSFTISNLGMFGISEFTAVINPPQACILAVGTSRVAPDAQGRPVTRMTVTLSSDARIVDASLAAQFLAVFKETLENPWQLIPQTLSNVFVMDNEDELEKLFVK